MSNLAFKKKYLTFPQLIQELINESNKINNSENDGTQDPTEQIPNNSDWKFYAKYDFNCGHFSFSIKLCKLFLKRQGIPVLIIPGISKRSFAWTIGNVNKHLEIYKNNKNISSIYIIEFNGLKEIFNELKNKGKNFYDSDYDEIVSNKIYSIILIEKFKKIYLVGRSAGAGNVLMLAGRDKIEGIYIACPGYKEKCIQIMNDNMNDNLNDKEIDIYCFWNINDTKIRYDDEKKGFINLYKSIKAICGNKVEVICTFTESKEKGDSFTHRIPEILVKSIGESK